MNKKRMKKKRGKKDEVEKEKTAALLARRPMACDMSESGRYLAWTCLAEAANCFLILSIKHRQGTTLARKNEHPPWSMSSRWHK